MNSKIRLIVLSILAAGVNSAAYADRSLDYFLHSAGPAARPTMILGWVFTTIVCAVCIIVGALLLIAIFRKRMPGNADAIGKESEGVRWILIGTGISTAMLFAMTIYALIVLNQTIKPPATPAITMTVTAYDWWWKVDYQDSYGAMRFTTANEIHIPVGVPVLIKLKSADVIHAFWVPELAGKTETIPGLTNQQWLQADEPGIYHGKCTQFCGLQHAHMDFEVVAQSRDEFEQWLNAQQQPANAAALKGQQIFSKSCGACHAIRGTPAEGGHGPDLTHLMSRRMIGAGMLPATRENIMNWVAHVQDIKPGAQMPDIALSPTDASALSVYLSTLK